MTLHPDEFMLPSGHHSGSGITVREWLAGLAMQGLNANAEYAEWDADCLAKSAVVCADALIAELNRPKEQKP